jgi:hypothetical protein
MASDSVACLLNPGLICTFVNGIAVLYHCRLIKYRLAIYQ